MKSIILSEKTIHLLSEMPIIDVRTPTEFLKGHIPFAHNVPLLHDEERVAVGIDFKYKGREAAIKSALVFVGTRLASFFENIESILKKNNQKKCIIYCWRGGMRSKSVCAWLTSLGIDTYQIDGGYKIYRTWIRLQFEKSWKLTIISGATGSGKTELLHKLLEQGEQILDIEAHAHHTGSVFGGLSGKKQPSQEQFENNLGSTLYKLDQNKNIWIEDESRKIGTLFLPELLWKRMRKSSTYFIYVPCDERTNRLIRSYSIYDTSLLLKAINRLERIGAIIDYETLTKKILLKKFDEACIMLIKYYDACYYHGLYRRRITIKKICDLTEIPFTERAAYLIKTFQTNEN